MRNVPWTEFELDTLRKFYEQHGSQFCDEIIFAKLGRRRGRRNVMQKAWHLDIRYAGEPRGRIKPGNISPNKGKKMSAEVKAKCAPTMFKPGSIPHNQRPIGDDISVRINKGYKTVYLRIGIANWVPLARHTYESYYGPVPPKHMVVFKDGDPLNCDIKNLECISMAENARRNHNMEKIKRDAAELTDAYVVSYFKRYEDIELVLEEIDPNLLEMMRKKITLKRSLKKQQQ